MGLLVSKGPCFAIPHGPNAKRAHVLHPGLPSEASKAKCIHAGPAAATDGGAQTSPLLFAASHPEIYSQTNSWPWPLRFPPANHILHHRFLPPDHSTRLSATKPPSRRQNYCCNNNNSQIETSLGHCRGACERLSLSLQHLHTVSLVSYEPNKSSYSVDSSKRRSFALAAGCCELLMAAAASDLYSYHCHTDTSGLGVHDLVVLRAPIDALCRGSVARDYL